ncbi:MAG TPA: co-chaperone GroES [Candidatus Nanoarchaeia archaeon]|nr:co-chaperone GroES [Candidatus Nanoarchaeia archaeon]
MNLKPLGERVLIKLEKKAEKTKGGLYIPDTAKEEKKEGEVFAVGQFKDGKELPLKKGDRILYGGYSSEDFEKDGEKYVFVEFKDILAKFE